MRLYPSSINIEGTRPTCDWDYLTGVFFVQFGNANSLAMNIDEAKTLLYELECALRQAYDDTENIIDDRDTVSQTEGGK
jgi:hypothetical protein